MGRHVEGPVAMHSEAAPRLQHAADRDVYGASPAVGADNSRGSSSLAPFPPEVDLSSLPVDFLEAYPYPAFVFAYTLPAPVASTSNGGVRGRGSFLSSLPWSSTAVYPVFANAEWDKHGNGRTFLDFLDTELRLTIANWIANAHNAMLSRMAAKARSEERRRTEADRASLATPAASPVHQPPAGPFSGGGTPPETHVTDSHGSLTIEVILFDTKFRFELICTPLPRKLDAGSDSPYRLAIVTTTGRPRFVSMADGSTLTASKGKGNTPPRGNVTVAADGAVIEGDSMLEEVPQVVRSVEKEEKPPDRQVWTEVSQVLENMTPWKGGEAVWYFREAGNNGIMRPIVAAPSTEISVARLLEEFPFEQTPLGPRSTWDAITHALIDVLQVNPMAGTLWIGKELTTIYNQSTAEIIPDHPQTWGRHGDAALAEIQGALGALTEVVFAGIPIMQEDELFMTKYNQNETLNEMYGSQMWLPIRNIDGEFGALFNGIIETTKQVVGERRNLLLKTVAEMTANARSVDEFDKAAIEALSTQPKDVPFALLFHVDTVTPSPSDSGDALDSSHDLRMSRQQPYARIRYVGGVGVPEGHPSAPAEEMVCLLSQLEMVITEAFPPPMSPGSTDHMSSNASNWSNPRPGPRSPSIPMSQQDAAPQGQDQHSWPFLEAIRTRKPVLMKDCSKVIEGYPVRIWKRLPSSAVVMPIVHNPDSNQMPKAIFVLGISSRLPFDEDYDSFIQSLRLMLSSGLIAAEGTEADLRRMESLAALDRAKSMLFSNVFNELFTPLSLIAGPLDDVLVELGDGGWRESLVVAQRNVRRLTRLVSMLTEVSALESDRFSGSFSRVNLGVITRDAAAMFRKAASTAGLEFFVECDTTPRDVYVDTEQWEKILFNIIGNAVKHTREGSIKVALHYTSSSAVLTVKDTGIGIPAADVSLIQSNLNENQISAGHGDGAGIVLTFTKKLIQLHHGTFELEGQTAEETGGASGTICRVRIPLGRDHLLPSQVNESGTAKTTHAGQRSALPTSSTSALWCEELEDWDRAREHKKSNGKTAKKTGPAISGIDSNMLLFTDEDVIMVVDDFADSRRYIRSIFEGYCRVIEARDGLEALEKWEEAQPDLVIADYHMPRMGGKALLHALRNGHPEQRLVPFVMLTPAAVPRAVDEAYSADDYLLKPFNARELLSRAHMQLQLGKKRIGLEKVFNERTAELRVLTDLSPVGIFRTDSEGYITYVNPAWYEMSGYPRDGPVLNWGDYIHEIDKLRIRNRWETYLRTGATSIESEYRWSNGRWVTTKCIRLDRITDNMTGFIGSVVDITERKLREELQRQRVIEAEQRRSEAEEAKRQQELLIDITSHEIRNPISSLMQCSSLVKSNLLMLLGELREAERTGEGFHPTPQLLLMVEEDLEALDSIYQCGLTQERISNDVLSLGRIQLNMLQMFDVEADILKEAQRILSVFQGEARMKHIDLDLRIGPGFDRLGSTAFMLDPVRLGQVITNLISNAIRFTADSPVRNITLSLDAHLRAPSPGTCAPPEWDAEMEKIKVLPHDTVYLYISVRDTGPGLTESEHEILFQRFSQASAKIHTRFGGSGLGLFVSRKISELMGGRIEVLSTYGQGSEFRFFIEARIPQCLLAATAVAYRPQAPLPRKASPRALPAARVLVAEDNLINRTVLLRQLKHVGMEAESACNGQEALDKIRAAMALPPQDGTKRFDAVLMDLEMPVMDGYTATRLVREDEAEGKLAPSCIIALTGNARQAMIDTVMTDFTDVVIKPYRLDDLLQKINKHRVVDAAAPPPE